MERIPATAHDLKWREPFQQFRLHLKDGRVFTVEHCFGIAFGGGRVVVESKPSFEVSLVERIEVVARPRRRARPKTA